MAKLVRPIQKKSQIKRRKHVRREVAVIEVDVRFKRTFEAQKVVSALTPKADTCSALAHVCFGQIAVITPFSVKLMV